MPKPTQQQRRAAQAARRVKADAALSAVSALEVAVGLSPNDLLFLQAIKALAELLDEQILTPPP